MKEKYHLPEKRKVTQAVLKETPPHIDLRPPVIQLAIHGSLSKKDDPTEILRAALQTIDSYTPILKITKIWIGAVYPLLSHGTYSCSLVTKIHFGYLKYARTLNDNV